MMGALNALGLDGYGACFFQSFWHVVADDVCKVVLGFWNGGKLHDPINQTFITLIPKVSQVE